jgi:hypothetical protein
MFILSISTGSGKYILKDSICIIIDVEIWFFFKTAYIKFFDIYMIRTCAGIDKYTFYLDFKGVLSSTPQVSVGVTT